MKTVIYEKQHSVSARNFKQVLSRIVQGLSKFTLMIALLQGCSNRKE